MKRFFHFMTVIALAALTLTGCDDVPMPYNQPNIKPNEPSGTSSLPYSDSNLKDWTVSTVTGAGWSLASTYYAKATGFNSNTKTTTATETWLISPTINTTASEAVINFDHVIHYVKSATDINNHEMYISSDYTGDIKTATWIKLDYNPVEKTTDTKDWNFYAADPIQIPDAYLNKDVVIAFKFTCNDQNSTTWEIKNFSVKEGKAETGGGDTPTPDEPKGDGSQANPYNAAAANKAAAALSDGVTIENVYVSGIISEVGKLNDKYGELNYYVSDDGTKNGSQFYIYGGLGKNGAKFASESDLQVGQKVTVVGTLIKYNGTPEMQYGSKIISIEGSGSTPETPETPNNAISRNKNILTLTNSAVTAGSESISFDFNAQGLANATKAKDFTLEDGTKIVFDDNGEKNGPTYYEKSKGIRVYLNNTVSFNGVKKIAKIVITCDMYTDKNGNTTYYTGNEAAKVTFDGNNILFTNSDPNATNGGTHLRIQTITITYAK